MSKTIRVGIDRDIVDLAESFLSNRRHHKQEWRKAAVAGNAEALRNVGHELKGTAGSFGFHELASLAQEMEVAATEGDLEGTDTALERMIEFLDHVVIVPR